MRGRLLPGPTRQQPFFLSHHLALLRQEYGQTIEEQVAALGWTWTAGRAWPCAGCLSPWSSRRRTVLDAGSGTGENALFFAGQGHKVTGIDFIEEAISRARLKAVERGLPVTFLVKDLLTLKD